MVIRTIGRAALLSLLLVAVAASVTVSGLAGELPDGASAGQIAIGGPSVAAHDVGVRSAVGANPTIYSSGLAAAVVVSTTLRAAAEAPAAGPTGSGGATASGPGQAVLPLADPPGTATSTTATTVAAAPATTTPAPTTTVRPSGEWRPMRSNPDGSPVRYDPCTQIHYVTRLGGGPSFARAELSWAIAQIEGASGLDFVWDGDVSAPYSSSWPATAPVHLGFATESELPMPAGVSGYGDSTAVDMGDGHRRYVGGRVVLRPDHGWTQGTASANPLGLMFLHELGHVVGLAHVSSPDEVMTDRGNGTARALGPGDRAGLAAVGRPAGCLAYSR